MLENVLLVGVWLCHKCLEFNLIDLVNGNNLKYTADFGYVVWGTNDIALYLSDHWFRCSVGQCIRKQHSIGLSCQ